MRRLKRFLKNLRKEKRDNMKHIHMIICTLLLVAGCQIPTQVSEDMGILHKNNNAMYQFNLQLLDEFPVTDEESITKKLQLRDVINTVYHRTKKAITLLAEYFDSTQYVDSESEDEMRTFFEELIEKVKK